MSEFQALFGCSPAATAAAPGRVNLIGEHTDYNGGYVLPTVIPQRTRVELAGNAGRNVRVWSSAVNTAGILSYTLGAERTGRDWLDYIQGVTQILASLGFHLSGFDARIESTVPLGSGLSSSASLTVSLMRGLRSLFALVLDDVEIAQLGQRVENEFVGARVGIMDPMAASLAGEGTALFLDARTLEYECVPLPAGADLVVLHSGVSHTLRKKGDAALFAPSSLETRAGMGGPKRAASPFFRQGGDYNSRRRECEQAAALLGVRQLRELNAADLPRIAALPEPYNRRARHVVTENDRVLAALAAMRSADLARLGELFYASHASMKEDYEVSIPEIDLIVELARRDPAIYGARLTGGGFGGSVVMLAQAGMGRDAAERIGRTYSQQSGCQPRVLVPPAPQACGSFGSS